MQRAGHIAAAGAWPAQSAGPRSRSRSTTGIAAASGWSRDDGAEFLLDLPEATVLRHGDGLRLDDGSWIAVQAADEDVCDIACPTPESLARIAWHLGNRHLPVQVIAGGAAHPRRPCDRRHASRPGRGVTRRRAPFDAEGGAYAKSHGHHHHGTSMATTTIMRTVTSHG